MRLVRSPGLVATLIALPVSAMAFLGTWTMLANDRDSQIPGKPAVSSGPAVAGLRLAATPAGASRECRTAIESLPAELSGQRRRPGGGPPEWGEPPILFRCGLACPPGSRPPSSGKFAVVDGVLFYLEQDSQRSIWYAVDRTVVIGVEVPSRYQGQEVVFNLTAELAELPRSGTGRC